jgi:hypothetical protein
LGHLAGLSTAVNWSADFPEHHAGASGRASAEKGRKLVDLYVDSLARWVGAVKRDEVAPLLRREFFERERGLRG